MKTVRIKTEGCAIYPHNTIHQVLELKDGVYPTLDKRDRIPSAWCEEVSVNHDNSDGYYEDDSFIEHFNLTAMFTDKDLSWNKFRTLGYNANTTDKTGYFTEEDYSDFENYSKENNLDINKYE